MFPSGAPVETDAHSRAFSTYPPGSPAREPSLQVPFTELPQRDRERCSTSRAPFSYLSESPVDEPTPGCPTEPRDFLS